MGSPRCPRPRRSSWTDPLVVIRPIVLFLSELVNCTGAVGARGDVGRILDRGAGERGHRATRRDPADGVVRLVRKPQRPVRAARDAVGTVDRRAGVTPETAPPSSWIRPIVSSAVVGEPQRPVGAASLMPRVAGRVPGNEVVTGVPRHPRPGPPRPRTGTEPGPDIGQARARATGERGCRARGASERPIRIHMSCSPLTPPIPVGEDTPCRCRQERGDRAWPPTGEVCGLSRTSSSRPGARFFRRSTSLSPVRRSPEASADECSAPSNCTKARRNCERDSSNEGSASPRRPRRPSSRAPSPSMARRAWNSMGELWDRQMAASSKSP